MPSFDVSSETDFQEVRNSVDQASREVSQRYDFKGTETTIELDDSGIHLNSSTEDRLSACRQVLEEKLVSRKVSLKGLSFEKVSDAAGGRVKQDALLSSGISSEKGKEINKFIKELGLKGVQSQTQGDQVRVMGKKRDQLQEVIAALKERDFSIPLQFGNFRD